MKFVDFFKYFKFWLFCHFQLLKIYVPHKYALLDSQKNESKAIKVSAFKLETTLEIIAER